MKPKPINKEREMEMNFTFYSINSNLHALHPCMALLKLVVCNSACYIMHATFYLPLLYAIHPCPNSYPVLCMALQSSDLQ